MDNDIMIKEILQKYYNNCNIECLNCINLPAMVDDIFNHFDIFGEYIE